MRWLALTAMVCTAGLTAAGDDAETAKKLIEKLKGRWNIVKMESGG